MDQIDSERDLRRRLVANDPSSTSLDGSHPNDRSDEGEHHPQMVGQQVQGENNVHTESDFEDNGQIIGLQQRSTSRKDARASTACIVICAMYILITCVVHTRMNSYPPAKFVKDSKIHDFIEENARLHLNKLTELGPRVSGSEANFKAEKYIIDTIKQIHLEKSSNLDMDVDVQVTSGGFTLDFRNMGIGQFTSVYQELRNVIVKVSPVKEAKDSVLVNCHYDSVTDSPGAGDDGSSCAVMLEMLRVLSHTNIELMHNIIFLFNSAEENILQTSHGFITKHKWANNIKAFVNLDSAGAGGWELVFQTGPDHPWLIKAYIQSAPYPHASVVGQEVFQTGLIPSDTDFRIFRDYGHIPGIDIAYIKNGYVYHTRNDMPEFIPPGCMQRGGDNIIALLKTLATSPKLSDPGADKHGKMVFFDLIGFFMVAYPHRMALILNWSTIAYVYIVFVKKMMRDSNAGTTNVPTVMKQTSLCVLIIILTWVVVLVVSVAMALLMGGLDRSLSYFTHNLNVVLVFMLPAVTAAVTLHWMLKKNIMKGVAVSTKVQTLQTANLMVWTLVLAIATINGVMASYFPLVCILWPAVVYTCVDLAGVKRSGHTGVLISIVASLLPSVLAVQLSYTLLLFIIPIMGRIGMENPPDVLVAVMAAVPVMTCLPFHIGFVYSHGRVMRVIVSLAAISLLSLFCVVFTTAGFPYSWKAQDASTQRALLCHIDRQFHSLDGRVTHSDASVWYSPLDYNGRNIKEEGGVFDQAKRSSCDGVYCGKPYLYPFLKKITPSNTYDFPGSRLTVPRLQVVHKEREELGGGMMRLSFSLKGPSHVTIFMEELPTTKVLGWSFGEKVPIEIHTVDAIHQPTFFIYYSHAGSPDTTWHFSLDIQAQPDTNTSTPVINMGFAGHFLHGPHQVSEDVRTLEQHLPPWILPSRWSATYDQFEF